MVAPSSRPQEATEDPAMDWRGRHNNREDAMEVTLRRSPRAPFNCNRIASVKRCAPFVENKCGVLIHRPIEVAYRKAYLGGYIYTCVDFMCGNSSNGENKFTFLDVVPDGRVVCARCEAAAIEAGLPPSSKICGRHVCVGGVKAVSHCHPERTA